MENNKKVCNKECVTVHSEEWSLSSELAKNNKRMFTTVIIVIALWFATIVGFVWYINQYDYTNETITVETADNGISYYNEQSGDGVINNGTDSGTETETN